MNNRRSIAFIVELLGLFMLLILVIVMIAQVFVMSRARTIEAKRLNQAVMLAQSTAEAASSDKELSQIAERMQGLENVSTAVCDDAEDSLDIVFDTDGKTSGKDFCVQLHRVKDDRNGTIYVKDNIGVYYCSPGQLENLIYELDTGRHFVAEEAGS